jgi:hypothetical protein
MQSVAGIFRDRASAERAAHALRAQEVADDRVSILTPDMSAAEASASVSTTEGEQPGIGPTIGAVVGTAAGATSGMQVALAAAVTVLPLVGPVIITGMLAGAVVGAAAGAGIGKALESHLADGLPKDEWLVYEEALRRGRSVVIAIVESEDRARICRDILTRNGAETVDAARASWRIGLTDAPEAGRSPA